MEKNLEFRLLEADEIEARVGSCNAGGVTLLLYKDARVDMKLLDETVGPMNWSKVYARDNQNCIVSIRDTETGEWISKEDTGCESNTQAEKGLASDSFKRACFNWGIGRELYSANKLNIFIKKDKLKSHQESKGKWVCYDKFEVSNIEYNKEKRSISSVTIDVFDGYGNYLASETFKVKGKVTPITKSQPQVQTNSQPQEAEKKQDIKQVEKLNLFTIPQNNDFIKDEDVILFGKMKNYKYKQVKHTNEFQKLLQWVYGSDKKYNDPEQDKQFNCLKLFAQKYKIA